MGLGDAHIAEAVNTIAIAEEERCRNDMDQALYWLVYANTQALLGIAERLEPVAMRRAILETRQAGTTETEETAP